MPHNRPSTIDSCAMPGTIKGGFATPQTAQHHGIRARATQLPSRTTNRKEDEMFRARPRYPPPFGTGMRTFLYTDYAVSRRYGYSLSRDASR